MLLPLNQQFFNGRSGRFAVIMLADTPSAERYRLMHRGCLKYQ